MSRKSSSRFVDILPKVLALFKKEDPQHPINDDVEFSRVMAKMGLIGLFDVIGTFASAGKQILNSSPEPPTTLLSIYLNSIVSCCALVERTLSSLSDQDTSVVDPAVVPASLYTEEGSVAPALETEPGNFDDILKGFRKVKKSDPEN